MFPMGKNNGREREKGSFTVDLEFSILGLNRCSHDCHYGIIILICNLPTILGHYIYPFVH